MAAVASGALLAIAVGFMSTFLLFGLGWTLVGIATARAKVLTSLRPGYWLSEQS